MAEWSKAHAWKVCIPQKGILGSNPSLSAKNKPYHNYLAGLSILEVTENFRIQDKEHPLVSFSAVTG